MVWINLQNTEIILAKYDNNVAMGLYHKGLPRQAAALRTLSGFDVIHINTYKYI